MWYFDESRYLVRGSETSYWSAVFSPEGRRFGHCFHLQAEGELASTGSPVLARGALSFVKGCQALLRVWKDSAVLLVPYVSWGNALPLLWGKEKGSLRYSHEVAAVHRAACIKSHRVLFSLHQVTFEEGETCCRSSKWGLVPQGTVFWGLHVQAVCRQEGLLLFSWGTKPSLPIIKGALTFSSFSGSVWGPHPTFQMLMNSAWLCSDNAAHPKWISND